MASSRRPRSKRLSTPNASSPDSPGGAPVGSAAGASSSAASGVGFRKGRSSSSFAAASRASASPPLSTGRKWLYRLLAATLVPALFFVLLELILRVAGAGYPTDFFVLRLFGDQRVVTDNAQFGWQFFPRSLARQPMNFVLPEKKPEGTTRVFVLGGSAAMGDPDPSFSPARAIQVLLEARFTDRKFEVVNAAMTGINSHVARTIAADCADRQPDFFVVYMGNNEVIGPYGPGTVFGSFSPSLSMIRFGLWLKTTALAQTMEGLKAAGETPEEFKEWGGLRMFLKHPVLRDDPKLAGMLRHFAGNLDAIARAANSAGAKTIFCTVATNLGDCPPFASLHKPGLDKGEAEEFELAYEIGVRRAEDGNTEEALRRFDAALQIDDTYPELHYRLGALRLAAGNKEKAKEHFVLARETDALRFRADSRVNETVRAAAKYHAGQGARLVDAVALFEADSPDAVPGDNLFVDHVHLNFHGTWLLARAVAEQIAASIEEKSTGNTDPGAGGLGVPPKSQTTGDSTAPSNNKDNEPNPARDPETPFLSEDECARRMAYTPWNGYMIAEMMFGRLMKPPFTNQLDHAGRMERLEKKIRESRVHATAKGIDDAAAVYEAAIQAAPDDWTLHENYARLLQHTSRAAEEAAQWRAVLRRIPHRKDRYANLGQALARAGHYEEAIDACQIAIQDDPKNLNAYNGLGIALAGLGRADEAARYYNEALRIRPDYTDARNNLALLLAKRGSPADAVEHYKAMLRVNPNDAEVHHQLATVYIQQNEPQKALDHLTEAARLDPADASIQYNLGLFEAARGERQRAIKAFKRAIELDPAMTDARINLGTIYADLERRDDASIQFDAALKQRPDDPAANFNMGVLFEQDGEVEVAAAYYERAAKADPSHVRAQYRLGLCYEGLRKIDKAVAQYRIAQKLAPDWAEVENEMAWILCTLESPTKEQVDEAIRQAESACKRTDQKDPVFLDTLAAAYAAAGRFDDALRTAEKALGLARSGDYVDKLATEIQKRIQYYKDRRPYVVRDEPAEPAKP